MAMIVQHNLTAMNANRQLGVTTSGQSKSSEKLSSGYKINRAGDDAAGLKISEKMRSQVRGLNRASTNAQDGVSLIQTAEGALNEVHSILQRMNELAVQGSNDTNQDIDRDAINEELTALTTEIDRIASTTQFNKQELLDGNFTEKKLHVGANVNQNIEISIGAMNASAIGLKAIVSYKKPDTATYVLSGLSAATEEEVKKTLKDQMIAALSEIGSGTSSATPYLYNGVSYATMSAALSVKTQSIADIKANVSGATATSNVVTGATVVASEPTVADYDMAQITLSKVQEAINSVSSQRSALGALQNRLEHTIANLDNVAENTQAAESRIRDTDMASEMVEYSKNNILAQAGQSMLAQANQSTQGVLSLLQ